jgi:hypothetical protein
MSLMSPRSRELSFLLSMLKNVSSDRLVLAAIHVLTPALLEIGMIFVKKDEFVPVSNDIIDVG